MPAPTAFDSTGTIDLSKNVFALPGDVDPFSCRTVGCFGYEFSIVGVQRAALNTSAEVNSVQSVLFVVEGPDGELASAVQEITIAEPCAGGQNYCSGSCWAVPCEQVESLLGPDEDVVPNLRLVGADAIAIPYGSPLPGGQDSIVPCQTAAQVAMGLCGAVATDPSTGSVVPGQMKVMEVASPQDSAASPRCAPSLIGQVESPCLPGTYTYKYTVTSASGLRRAQLFRTILIQDDSRLVKVTILLPDDGSDAELRAEGLNRGESDEALQLRLGLLEEIRDTLDEEDPAARSIFLSAVHVEEAEVVDGDQIRVTLQGSIPNEAYDTVNSGLGAFTQTPVARRNAAGLSVFTIMEVSSAPPVEVCDPLPHSFDLSFTARGTVTPSITMPVPSTCFCERTNRLPDMPWFTGRRGERLGHQPR